ncbi:hypothetical protein ACIJDO_002010 [Enterococcus hirae]
MQNNQKTLESIKEQLITIASNLKSYDSVTFYRKISKETEETLSIENNQLAKGTLEAAVTNLIEMMPMVIESRLKYDGNEVERESNNLIHDISREKNEDLIVNLYGIKALNEKISVVAESLKKATSQEREQLISSIDTDWEDVQNDLNLLKKAEGITPDEMSSITLIEERFLQRKNFLNTYNSIHQVKEQFDLQPDIEQGKPLSASTNSLTASVNYSNSFTKEIMMKAQQFQKRQQESLKDGLNNNIISYSNSTHGKPNENSEVHNRRSYEQPEYAEVGFHRGNKNPDELNLKSNSRPVSTRVSLSSDIYTEVVDNEKALSPEPELWRSMSYLRNKKKKLYKDIIQLSKDHKVGTYEFAEKVERLLDIRYKIAIKKELIQKIGFDFTKILNNSKLLGPENSDMLNNYNAAISNFINQTESHIPQVTTDSTKEEKPKKRTKLYQEMKQQFKTNQILSGRESATQIYPLIVEALNKNIPNNLSDYDYYDLSKSKTLKEAGLHKWGNVRKILDGSNQVDFDYLSPNTKDLQYVKQSKKELKELESVFNKQVTKFYGLFKNAKTSRMKDEYYKLFTTSLSNLRDLHHQLETTKTIENMLGMDYEKFCHKYAQRNNVDPQKIIYAWQETVATQLKYKSPNLLDDIKQEVGKRFQDVTSSADPESVKKLNELFNMNLYKGDIAIEYLENNRIDCSQARDLIIMKVNYIKQLDKVGSYKTANKEFIELLPKIDKLLKQYTLIEQPFYHINTPINECPTLKNLGIKDCREYLPDPVKKIEPLYAEVNKNKGMNPENAQGRLLNIINGAQSKVQQDAQNQQLDPSKGKPSNDLLRETSV